MGYEDLPNEIVDTIGSLIDNWDTFRAMTQVDIRHRLILLRKADTLAQRFPIFNEFLAQNPRKLTAFLNSAARCRCFDEVFAGAGIRLKLGDKELIWKAVESKEVILWTQYCKVMNIQHWFFRLWKSKTFRHRTGLRVVTDRDFLAVTTVAIEELQDLTGNEHWLVKKKVDSIDRLAWEVWDLVTDPVMPRARWWCEPMGKFTKEIAFTKSADALMLYRHWLPDDPRSVDEKLQEVIDEFGEILKLIDFGRRVLSGFNH